MKPVNRRTFLKTVPAVAAIGSRLPKYRSWQQHRSWLPALAGRLRSQAAGSAAPFGQDYPQLDSQTTGQWWVTRASEEAGTEAPGKAVKRVPQIIELNVPRDQVVAFALYTHDAGVLKLSAQLYPLHPDEPREARLEVQRDGGWKEVAKAPVEYPGWSAHFRVERWDGARTVPYRVRHGGKATFEGTIRRDPLDKEEIVVANLGCNSSRTKGARPEIVQRLLRQDPDLLFFSGDQTYHHTEHTAGWIEFGLQYRDVIKNRPTVCVPDDHDVGHPNLWGEEGGHSTHSGGADGGYFFPAAYVNMVQRAQCWHLPDPVDPAPVRQGINVYFTRLRVGGIDFAILEDRKFKTGPMGTIPEMGPRPDHINDERYDPRAIDLPGLELLGQRQLKFLRDWTEDWTGAAMKCVLSQTAFCGAVHLHGNPDNRLLADLDCNGWPQSGRNAALREIRKARATHLCGDQHLAVTLKHGIDEHRDGPYGFTSPALVNTIYGRWWHPKDERAGANPVPGSPLPWTGDYRDGLGNRISIMAYANPEDLKDERKRADGYGLVRFNKKSGQVTFECWPRFSQGEQFPGWPITVRNDDNDGRRPVGWLPELVIEGTDRSVVQVIAEAGGEILYSVRVRDNRFQPHVYSRGSFTVKVGRNRPDGASLAGLTAAASKDAAGTKRIKL
jgi:3',5'-cyclic AMP phosphodiesterase CpdA